MQLAHTPTKNGYVGISFNQNIFAVVVSRDSEVATIQRTNWKDAYALYEAIRTYPELREEIRV